MSDTHTPLPRNSRLLHFFFFCLLMLAATLVAPCPASSAPTPEQRYETAKDDMERLRKDARRSSWREPWQKIAQDFLDVYEKGRNWNNRPAALYRAGLAQEEIARRSAVRADAQLAAATYERLAKNHPKSVLADDALLRAARIKAELLEDRSGAEELLKQIRESYADGDMAASAERYARALNAPADAPPPKETKNENAPSASEGKKATSESQAVIKQVSWQTRRNLVKVILEIDRPVSWTAQSQAANAKTGSPNRLLIDLADSRPDSKIRPGVKITDSFLSRIRLDLSASGHTRLLLDFSDLKRFNVSTESSPFRLVISAAKTDGALPGGSTLGKSLQSEEPVRAASGMLPSNIAKQLGLSVASVMIDAGHGGKDPGTSHNGIIEREVTLDIAKQVGALLAARGMKVYYTRTNNSWVSLEARSQKANEVKADLMISIHVNASLNPAITGLETYYLNFASSSDAVKLAGVENAMSDRKLGELEGLLADLMLGARTQESRRLARNVQDTTLARLGKKKYSTKDGGIKSAPFHVLLGSGMPGVLVEVGYCTNKQEAKRLASPAYRAALADGIASGILVYAGKLAN